MSTCGGRGYLRAISISELRKNLARKLRHSPSSTRASEPRRQLRAPQEAGVGIFFYPPDSWEKKDALATGPLGTTSNKIHRSRIQITRPIALAPDQPDSSSESTSPDSFTNAGVPELLQWGLGGSTTVVKNLISGVSEGFAVTLELHGVGYRAEANENENLLTLRVGLSHTIDFPLDDGEVFFRVLSPQLVQVCGINRSKVHQKAAKVRSLRKPEPYKGKGIRYQLEPVRIIQSRKDG